MSEVTEKTIEALLQHPEEGATLLRASLKKFIKVFFYYVYRKQFTFKPFHDELVSKLEDIVFGRAEKKNLYIGISPRFGKSVISQLFVAWCYTLNKDCNFIMVSYGDKLVLKFSGQSKSIISSELYQKLFEIKCQQDTTAKDLWKIDGGGEFRATSMRGVITGFGAGTKQDIFGGACFPYNAEIFTEKGKRKIGELVNNKENIRVWSYNIKNGSFELKPVVNWVKNNKSEIVRVYLNNGDYIDCTPDHKFYTINRGYVEAKDLKVSDVFVFAPNSFKGVNRNTDCFANFFSGSCSIVNISNFFVRKLSSISFVVKNFFCKSFKRFSRFNSTNGCGANSITFCNFSNSSFVSSNFYNVFLRKFCSRKNKCSIFNCILHIFGFRSITKIIKSVVLGIAIKMSNFHSFWFWTNKSKHNSRMDCHCAKLSILVNCYSRISKLLFYGFKKFTFIFSKMFASFVKGCMIITSDSSKIRNTVVCKTGYCSPLFVRKIRHNKHSYCLTVQDNNNMLLCKSQMYVVSNCIIDDYLKADNYKSAVEKQNCIDIYTNTLKSRLNSPKTPIIIIAQRLATDDLVGWLEKNEPDDWDFFVVPTLDENGESIWEEQMPAKTLIKMRDTNPFLFYSQYQQNPIVLGGTVLKEEWFRFYPNYKNAQYKRLFMTADTALKVKEANDFTAIGMWGITTNNELYLLDMIHGKWEAPDLERQFISFWNKWRVGIGGIKTNSVYIEDKASGTGLIQSIRRKGGIPVIPIEPEKDKLTRVMDVSPYIESGLLYLPMSKEYEISKKLISECTAFTADDRHEHDDMVDMMTMALTVAYRKSPMRIKEGWENELNALDDDY